MQLAESVQVVAGVGPRRAEQLRRAGVLTVGDLLAFLPRRYEDRSRFVPVSELVVGEAACVDVIVRSSRRVGRPGRRSRTELRADDCSGSIDAVWFNQGYVADALPVGSRVCLYGRAQRQEHGLQLVNPVHQLLGEDSPESPHVGRHVPVYPRAGGLASGPMRRLLASALDGLGEIPEPLPPSLVDRRQLLDLDTALRQVHYPPADVDLDLWNARRSPAHRRLIMQEFIDYQAALMLQQRRVATEPGMARLVDEHTQRRVEASLPFQMTAAQHRCTSQIIADLCAERSMHRLLQGDVGCGKTAVAACAMFAVALHGEQAVLLVPSALVAEQHARTLGVWAAVLGLDVVALTAATKGARRRDVLARLESGEGGVVVGTQALLQPQVCFKRLGLVVVDEQHRFGVAQRALLGSKGRRQHAQPDLLVMTATPIPRSLALSLYGDLDVSCIDELPPGRAPVSTRWLQHGDLGELDDELR
ncbi:MAG TPA: DEAD/DEAH box helicase, partial [Acidobacteriota bacterium]|nr:DEAD/DEAH box helicase [Acidobacteriota bacterium]